MLMIEVECYSRVSGYFRPVSQWNNGKKSEMQDRKFITKDGINNAINEKNRDKK